jgi:tetratricopeptide (TPR) repeat protein
LRLRWGVLAVGLLTAAAIHAAAAATRAADAGDARSVAGLTKSIAIEESRSGAASPHLLPLLDRLAGVQVDDGALAEAAASRRRALKIAMRAYGGDSTNAANAMVGLADVQIMRHRYAEAEPLLITAVPLLERRLGANSPVLAAPLAGLARVALARGDLPTAEAWANKANAGGARRPAQISSEGLRVLGAVYAAENRFDDSERVLREAITRDGKARTVNGFELARSLAQLGNLLLRAGRFEDALPVIEQTIAIDQERLGGTHPLIADDFADLGLIYAGLGRDGAAADALYFAIDLLERGSSEESARLGYLEIEIAPILRRLGQKDDADAAFKDGKRILDSAAEEERDRERQL